MNFWEPFWEIVLLVSLIGFAGLAIVVSIGGLSDIRAMLRRVEEQHKADSTSKKPEERRQR